MDILTKLQRDIADYLATLPEFEFVPVFVERDRDEGGNLIYKAQLDQVLAGATLKGGKCGLAAIVQMPVGSVPEDKMRGPYMQLTCTVSIIEEPLSNAGPTGTGKTCEQQALDALRNLHLMKLGAGIELRGENKQALQMIESPNLIEWLVRTFCFVQLDAVDRVADITFANAANTISLTTATAGDAIYYTDDGTFPDSTNGTLYAVPFVVVPPLTLRACAFKTGLSPSNVIEKAIS